MSQSIVIKGATVVNRESQQVADVKIENGFVVEVAKNLKGDLQLDASGCIVSSGFVDLHAHLREPSKEEVVAHLVNLSWNGLSGLEADPQLTD